MKHMKFYKVIFLIFCSLFFSVIKAQTNDLTVEEFLNIEVENVKLSDIKATQGDKSLVNSLFENNFTIETGEEPGYWQTFTSESIDLDFDDGLKVKGEVKRYQLVILSIKDSSICLKLKNIEVRIGDPISILGNTNFLTYSDGITRVTYKIGAQVIVLEYDSKTNLIISIKYRYYNT